MSAAATIDRTRAIMPHDIAARLVDPKAHGEWNRLQQDLTWLRREMPLGIAEAEGYNPFWVVTKHADIQEVGRQPQIFSNNGVRKSLITRDFERRAIEARAEGRRLLGNSLLTMDPPVHMPFRMLTFAQFQPKGIKVLERDMRALAREAIDAMAGHDSCDFVETVALRYPLRVILSLLGLPRSDEELLLNMTQRFFAPQDRELAGEQTGNSIGATSNHDLLFEMMDYFVALTESRRANPTGDVASVIANATIGGEPISLWDAASYYMTITTAGHDTTSSSTAGAAWAMALDPGEFAKVKADRSLIPGLVDEAIRWTSPVVHFMRTAEQDYELRGQLVRAGDWMMMCYPSANRDEEVFDDPFAFRVDRTPNPQLAFGYGAHVCLGQHLARMEMRIFFEEFFERVESIELAGEPKRIDSIMVGGIKKVPLRYTLAS